MVGVLLGDRLVKNLSFPEDDGKPKKPQSVHKARCDALKTLLCVGDEGSVVSKEVPDQPLLGRGVGL